MRTLEVIHKTKGKSFLFKVETSHDQQDYEKYEQLRCEIWGKSDDSMAGSRNMHSENYFSDGNCLFIAVYAEDDKGQFKQDREHLAGFSYGFIGVKDPETGFREPDNVVFYSQYTGVKEDYQHLGLGVLMKEFQGDVVRDVFGIHIITCTFDPLTGINAYRNIHCFGMDVVEYREDCYRGFAGKLNRADVPSDRLYVSWDFNKPVQRPVLDLHGLLHSGDMAVTAKLEKVKGRSGPVLLEVVEEADPEMDREFLLVEIPFDFYRILRETDVQDQRVRRIPIEWREAIRSAIQSLLGRQYRIVDFRWLQEGTRKRDFYVFHGPR